MEFRNPVLQIQLFRKSKIEDFMHSSFDIILTPMWLKNHCKNDRFNCSDYCIDEINVCDGTANCPYDEVDCGEK